MARKTAEEKQETYRKLLASASTLFLEKGVATTTLNEIAQHAGMTRGAVYWHFENKYAIIMALWEEGAGAVHKDFMTALKNLGDAGTAAGFHEVAHSVLRQVLDDPAYSRSLRILMHCVEFSDVQTPLNEFLMQKQQDYVDGLTSAFKQVRQMGGVRSDLSDRTLASGLLSFLFGMIHHHLEPCGHINLPRDGAALLDIYLNGVLVYE